MSPPYAADRLSTQFYTKFYTTFYTKFYTQLYKIRALSSNHGTTTKKSGTSRGACDTGKQRCVPLTNVTRGTRPDAQNPDALLALYNVSHKA